MNDLIFNIVIMAIKILVVLAITLGLGAYLTWYERKFAGHLQARRGPTVVGPFGLLQPLADGIKLMTKAPILPRGIDAKLYYMAIMMALIPAIMLFAVVPFGPTFMFMGHEIKPIVANLNVAILYVFAMGSMAAYGTLFAGWASNSKYAFIGSLRKAALIVSYEVVLGFAALSIILLAGSMNVFDIVNAQIKSGTWYIIYQPISFVLFLFCMLAESGRVPFDIQEAEAELVTGYNVEYGGMKFGIFPLAEWYLNTLGLCAIASVLYLGGWSGPNIFGPISGFVWFGVKTFSLLFFVIWVHWTLPRYQAKDVVEFAWKYLLPISIINLVTTAFLVYFKM